MSRMARVQSAAFRCVQRRVTRNQMRNRRWLNTCSLSHCIRISTTNFNKNSTDTSMNMNLNTSMNIVITSLSLSQNRSLSQSRNFNFPDSAAFLSTKTILALSLPFILAAGYPNHSKMSNLLDGEAAALSLRTA